MLFAYDLPKFVCNWLLSTESDLWLFDFNAEIKIYRRVIPSASLNLSFYSAFPAGSVGLVSGVSEVSKG